MLIANNRRAFLWLALLLSLSFDKLMAGQFSASVTNVHLDLVGDKYLLSASLNYRLSKTAEEALNNGVPLSWTVFIKIHRPRHVLWDKTLFESRLRYRLQYHALLNSYRVILDNTGQAYNFPALSAALEFMANLHGIPILSENKLAQEKLLLIELKLEFDRAALPLPLRPFAYYNRQWDLSSEWTQTKWTR